jgi:hypothetical protein
VTLTTGTVPLLVLLTFAAPAIGPKLIIEAQPGLEAAAARVRAFGTSTLANLVETLGLTEPGPPIRVVLADERSFVAQSTPPWIAGFASSAQGIVVLFPARTPSYPDDSLESVLDHEVAHVLIARAADGRPLPRWFNEGLAMAVEHTWGLEDTTRFAIETLWAEPESFDHLDELFEEGESASRRAYALSGAFVRDLLQQQPGAGARILSLVARGQPFGEAFRLAAGLPLPQAEEAFLSRQSSWKRWVLFLSSSLSLWMIVTLLALYAIRKRRQKSAALRRRWEEEDGPGSE